MIPGSWILIKFAKASYFCLLSFRGPPIEGTTGPPNLDEPLFVLI